MTAIWTAPTNPGAAYRRASGRRRYNAGRKRVKQHRRMTIILRLAGLGTRPWGIQKALAEALDVSEATISRDLEAIRNASQGALLK